ncbi:MAG: proline dehydrogenase family protein [Vicinamibacteraceae bacterium]
MTSVLRSTLLACAESAWLRERATRYRFIRRSVSRFMPGERFEDALAAAHTIGGDGAASTFTHLGENVTSGDEADAVARHYLDVLDRLSLSSIDAQVSVKLTQLGLDLGVDACYRRLRRLVHRSAEIGTVVWIDMESTGYVDQTLAIYRRIRDESRAVGVCLQAYLRRTAADLAELLPLGPAIRLVKGAYREPDDLILPRKRDVDENFFRLAVQLLSGGARRQTAFLAVGTHDQALIDRIGTYTAKQSVPHDRYEFAMLYGIRTGLQRQLVASGGRVRVLISYGDSWFPWYMRRLAERPANMLFVAKSLLGEGRPGKR